LVARTHLGVCAVLRGDARATVARDLRSHYPRAALIANESNLTSFLKAVVRYVETPFLHGHLPLDLRGSAFQHRVWNTLQQLPPGKLVADDALARRLEMFRWPR
jgi:AraC family transcriptional regulator of adaptative response/methylated-DNA-[protein]-cysteine methyltransferase